MKFGLLCFALLLSSCGVIYNSPRVKDTLQDGTQVNVIDLSAETIGTANRSKYEPKSLPSAFFATAGTGEGQLRSTGALPRTALGPQTPPNALKLRVPPEQQPGPYLIGVSDVLLLATKGTGSTVEELSGLLAAQNQRQGYTVQDDGEIAIPEVGRIEVDGLTLEEAEAAVFQRLVENQIDPTFSIEISDFNSKRVSIGGAVAEPGITPITLKPLYLQEALSNVGGVIADDDSYAVVRLYREGELYQIPVSKLYDRDGLKRILLLDGDSVFVDTTYELERATLYFEQQIRLTEARASARRDALSALGTEISLKRQELAEARGNFTTREGLGENDRDYVYITGEVTRQNRFALPYGRDAMLADAIYNNGGVPTQSGNLGQLYLLRGSESLSEITAYRLDGSNALNLLLATRMELRPNDIIFVSEQPITKWNRVITQILPTLSVANQLTD